MEPFDLTVIGSGPGGYVAAVHAAKRGLKVACIEKEHLGGTCLNVGCIPSKALLHSTEYYQRIAKEGALHGIYAEKLTVDLSRMMERKNKIVSELKAGVSFLFKKNKVHLIQGKASLVSPTEIAVNGQTIVSKNILLATGSEPVSLPFLPFDEKVVLSSTGALALKEIPRKLAIIGSGIIGLELGSVYKRLGSDVEVIEILDRITPTLDKELADSMLAILKKQGFIFHLASRLERAEVGPTGIDLFLEKGNTKIHADVVLVAIGRRPYTEGLGLEKVGVKLSSRGHVVVNGLFQTNVPTIFAIGDLIEGLMLAHVASEEGSAVVDYLCHEKSAINYLAIPNVMYTWPEVATVGLTEEEAKNAGLRIKVGKVPFRTIARSKASGDEEGFVKIIGESKTDLVIGLHMIGPNVSEMIHEGALAIEKRMTLKEIGHVCHAHPTCSEAIKEAALVASNVQ